METDSIINQILFFEKHDIYIHTCIAITGTDEFEHGYIIDYIPAEFRDAKRRCPHFVKIRSFKEFIGGYDGTFKTKQEAIKEAIIKARTLI